MLKNVVGLVTGGASGLGRATAARFVREGAKVTICDLPTSQGEAVAKELSAGKRCCELRHVQDIRGWDNSVKTVSVGLSN